MPGRPVPSSTVGQEVDEAAGEATAPYLDPSFSNTAPPSQTPQHDEYTRSSVYFVRHFSPFGHFILSFMLNKTVSKAWRHALCVCRLLFLPHYLSIHFPKFVLDRVAGIANN